MKFASDSRVSDAVPHDATAKQVRDALAKLLLPDCVWDASTKNDLYDYDTFEKSSDRWQSRNYATPRIADNGGSFCGAKALYMEDTTGRGGGWGRNFENGLAFSTATYKYMCLAYRIPPGTRVNMLISLDYDTSDRNGYQWKSIELTQRNFKDFPRVATWNKNEEGEADPLKADDQWHHKCINVHAQLEEVWPGRVHTIKSVIWHSGDSNDRSYTGSFWIDEFTLPQSRAR